MQHCILGAKLGTNCPYEYNKNNKDYSLSFHRPVKTRLLAQSVSNWGPEWAHLGLAYVGPKWNPGTELGGPLLGSPSGAQLPAHVGPTWGPHGNADWVCMCVCVCACVCVCVYVCVCVRGGVCTCGWV